MAFDWKEFLRPSWSKIIIILFFIPILTYYVFVRNDPRGLLVLIIFPFLFPAYLIIYLLLAILVLYPLSCILVYLFKKAGYPALKSATGLARQLKADFMRRKLPYMILFIAAYLAFLLVDQVSLCFQTDNIIYNEDLGGSAHEWVCIKKPILIWLFSNAGSMFDLRWNQIVITYPLLSALFSIAILNMIPFLKK